VRKIRPFDQILMRRAEMRQNHREAEYPLVLSQEIDFPKPAGPSFDFGHRGLQEHWVARARTSSLNCC